MSSYFEHFGGKGKSKPDVALDVIEFEPDAGIKVEERQFDSTGQFRAFVEREIGRKP